MSATKIDGYTSVIWIAAAGAAVALLLALGACTHAGVAIGDAPGPDRVYATDGGHGPPPHAPAHGYRRKQHDAHHGDVELVFDSGLGVYVVVGFPSHYWLDGTYYWNQDGAFRISASIDGPWEPSRSLPPGLEKAKGKPANAKGKAKKS